jgi:flagellar protein FliJ
MGPKQIERVRRCEEFKASQSRQRANQIKTMIVEFDRMCADLKLQIEAEEMRTRNFDPTHFAYPTYAQAARDRCARVQKSASALWAELDALRSEENEHPDQKFAA